MESLSHSLFVGGLGCKAKKKRELCLLNLLLGSAKLAIWRIGKKRIFESGSVDPVEAFKGGGGRWN